MMKKPACASALIAASALSLAWTGFTLYRQRPVLPVGGILHRSTVDPTVDRGGHSRGIVQVDLMRQIMAERARAVPSADEHRDNGRRRVRSQSHPLLGHPAPPLVLRDTTGKTRDLGAQATVGPIVVVFYLGSTCMACMTHLVELEAALPRFRERGGQVWAVSADPPELTRERMRKYGSLKIPLLSDPDHSVALAYGVWKPIPASSPDDGEALHGTFLIDRGGALRWANISDRPFRDIDALLAELDTACGRVVADTSR